MGRSLWGGALISASAAFHPGTLLGQAPQACRTLSSEVTLGLMSGRRIDSVIVETAAPDPGRTMPKVVGRLHVRTRPDIIRRELLFAAGDTVDTLRVAESLRRLRTLPYIQFARVQAQDCGTTTTPSPIQLIVETRDAWTIHTQVKLSHAAPTVGITEHNLMGMGRSVSVGLASNAGALGLATMVSDPFGFGTGITTRGAYQRYTNGSISTLTLGRRRASLEDRWRAEFDVFDLRQEPRSIPGDDFERTEMSALIGMRLSPLLADHAVRLLGGVYGERVMLSASPTAPIVGPFQVNRRMVAPVLGLAVESARFDTLTWLLPDRAIVDIPRTIEGEFIAGAGPGVETQSDSSTPATLPISVGGRHILLTHFDGWVGREWRPTQQSRVVTDLWASGYSGTGTWQSNMVRAAINADRAASSGLWNVTAAAERLTDPDPDVRALTIFDRLLSYVPPRERLSEAAFALSVERTHHLRRLSSSFIVDGSVFAATSWRWDPAAAPGFADDLAVSAIGIGLSLMPSRQGNETVRLDLGVPVNVSGGIPRKPRLTLTVVPWLESLRHRDAQGL